MRNITTQLYPDEEHAVITFLRPSGEGLSIRLAIWDDKQLVGVLNARSAVQYKATPGEHIFIGLAGTTFYLKSNLEAGKKYYVLVRPMSYRGFELDPIKHGDEYEKSEINALIKNIQFTAIDGANIKQYIKNQMHRVLLAIQQYENAGADPNANIFLDTFESGDNW